MVDWWLCHFEMLIILIKYYFSNSHIIEIQAPCSDSSVRQKIKTTYIFYVILQEATFDIKLPRRSLLVQFTCNKCDARTKRLINRVAYERGTVFLQVNCLVHLFICVVQPAAFLIQVQNLICLLHSLFLNMRQDHVDMLIYFLRYNVCTLFSNMHTTHSAQGARCITSLLTILV
jgi:hypothetical protein